MSGVRAAPSKEAFLDIDFAPPEASASERRAYRAVLAQRQLPAALLVAGLVTLAFGLIFRLQTEQVTSWAGLSFLAGGGVMIVFGLIVRRIPVKDVHWAYGVAMAGALAGFVVRGALTGSVEIQAFSAVLAIVLVSLALSWRSVLLGWALLTVTDLIVLGLLLGDARQSQIPITTFAAMVFGAGLVYARIRTVNVMADLAVHADGLASTDPLTGLLNRHGLDVGVPFVIGAARRLQRPVLVAYIDVDGLKKVNDTYGHDAGDGVITTVASALRGCSRADDLVARVGGDEFVVVGVGDPGHSESLATRLTEAVKRRCTNHDKWPGVVSVGMATADPDDMTITQLMEAADGALYASRAERRA